MLILGNKSSLISIASPMKLLSQAWIIARIEVSIFLRFSRMRWAALIAALVPGLYVLLYLSSLWDPAAHTDQLPVALVNLDRGLVHGKQDLNVGQEVVDRLKIKKTFGYRDLNDETLARQMVRQGQLAFALIIPPEFSLNALPGLQHGAGKLVLYVSEGNSYQSATLARRFAQDLGHEVNESLNEQRWELVLQKEMGSLDTLELLRQGVAQLRTGSLALFEGTAKASDGAHSLALASEQLDSSVQQMTGGIKDLRSGLQAVEGRLPAASQLNQLNDGAQALVSGHRELAGGLRELAIGSQSLKEGVSRYHEEAKSSLFVTAQVSEGLEKMVEGTSQLSNGVQAAQAAQGNLSEGAVRLGQGIAMLGTGVQQAGDNLRTVLARLPQDSQLQELTTASVRLATGVGSLAEASANIHAGSQQVNAGISVLIETLPDTLDRLEGSPQGLAQSVTPEIEAVAAVQNNGSGFAPNIIPVALWLGAGVAVFLVRLRELPRQAIHFGRTARMLGKVACPVLLVITQAMVVLLVIQLLGIKIAHPGALLLTLMVSVLGFLMIVIALTRALGDVGTALAMLLLAIQLTSSGGLLPIELSAGPFAAISPWLPMTWVVHALKAAMFDAFNGQWQAPLLQVMLAAGMAFVMASWFGNWRFVRPSNARPALNL